VEQAVRERYASAAHRAEPALCCPVDYDAKHLEVLPQELIERDYGCGDPSRYVAEGETVLDLGSGGGKICYIASQVVGPQGRVIGVDCNEAMLALAQKHQHEIGERIGWHNTEFRRGRIQDLALDLEKLEQHLAASPVQSAADWQRAEAHARALRASAPLVADDSIDVIVSNCVLNLVDEEDRQELFAGMYRVLRRGGRAVISDIVADEPAPVALKNDPQLWSGCISGAHVEDEFLAAFEQAGFYGIEIVARQSEPWAVVQGIEFRSMTVCAYKGKDGPCLDQHQAVIYRGPWRSVTDDDGHVLRRGVRTAVCGKTFGIYSQPPYADQIESIRPLVEISAEQAEKFDCRRNAIRSPRESKGSRYDLTQLPDDDCCGSTGCC
jgi:ubiquinone/menaquinone biosynthesis C-methylase UbiE